MKNLWLLFFFIPVFLFGQNTLVPQSPVKLNLANQIINIREACFIEDRILLLGGLRVAGSLNLMIVELNPTGQVIREKEIGDLNSFERPIRLLGNGQGGFYLMSNRLGSGKLSLKFYHLDKNLEINQSQEISIPDLSEGNDFLVQGEKTFLLLSLMDATQNLIPGLAEYNLEKKEMIHLNRLSKKNGKVLPKTEMVTKFKYDEEGNLLKGEKIEVAASQYSAKVGNRLRWINESTQELVLAGFENTASITDFWACSIKERTVQWEKIYLTELGGDEARDLFVLDNGQLLLTGVGYTKSIDTNYKLRSILLDSNGELMKTVEHKEATRTLYKDATSFGKNYAILGQAEDVEYTQQLFGEKVKSSNATVLILDEKLHQVATWNQASKDLVEVLQLLALSDRELVLFYKVAEDLFFLKIN